MSTVALDSRAVALTAYRVLPNGRGRQYTATTFPADPFRGCETVLRQALGRVGRWPSRDPYAVLDVLDEHGDIVQDFPIPTAEAFRWVKARLNLAVEASD